MNYDIVRSICIAIACPIMPIAYVSLCVYLSRQRAWWFTYFAYFFLCGTIGGWAIALATSPSGTCASSLVFLITIAPISCFISSVVLACRKNNSRAERIAMLGGYVYIGFLVALVCIALALMMSRAK
jgi:hypothetical protein